MSGMKTITTGLVTIVMGSGVKMIVSKALANQEIVAETKYQKIALGAASWGITAAVISVTQKEVEEAYDTVYEVYTGVKKAVESSRRAVADGDK